MIGTTRFNFPVYASSVIPQQPDPIVDEYSASVTYIGYAGLNTKEDEEKWLVVRVTKTGTVTKTEYPNASMKPNQKWSDRLTLSYAR